MTLASAREEGARGPRGSNDDARRRKTRPRELNTDRAAAGSNSPRSRAHRAGRCRTQDTGSRSAHDPDAPRPRTHGQVPRAGGFPALLSQAASLAVICLQLLKGTQKVLIQKEPRSLPTPLRETGETLQSGAPFSAAGLRLPQESAAAPASEQDAASSQPAGPGAALQQGLPGALGVGEAATQPAKPAPCCREA